jgi:hypothetical protein
LLVAIPGLLMSNRLARTADRLKTDLDELTVLLRRRLGGGAPVASSAEGRLR